MPAAALPTRLQYRRPDADRRLPDRHYSFWAALPKRQRFECAVAAELLSRRSKDSLVGDCAIDRFGRDEYADDHQHSWCGVRWRLWIFADRYWLYAGANRRRADFFAEVFQGAMLTAYQLIDQRFGHTLHKVTAGLFLLTRAAAEGVRVVCGEYCGGHCDWQLEMFCR